jgi:ribosomal protein S18 acetylase RimI-like enzyme
VTAPKGVKPIVIEPLDPAKHDRARFSCSIEQADNFFRRTANKLAKAGKVRTFVLVGSESALIGFYATNAHAIDYTELPERFARTRPAHGSIPAAYISMIGVDSRFQGRGTAAICWWIAWHAWPARPRRWGSRRHARRARLR